MTKRLIGRNFDAYTATCMVQGIEGIGPLAKSSPGHEEYAKVPTVFFFFDTINVHLRVQNPM